VLNWYVRMSSDRESQIVAVERLQEYAELAPEEPPPPSSSDGDHRQNAMVVASGGGGANGSSGRRQWPAPPRDWPTHGKVEFEKCRMRYRPGLPLVLKGEQEQGLTCTIEPGQKVLLAPHDKYSRYFSMHRSVLLSYRVEVFLY
jgi:ABC-type multidrug transport system fused ATPase/permease subunit